VGVDLRYFTDKDGFSKKMTPFAVPGMKWKYWLAVVKDRQGRERLAIHYRSMKSLGEAIESGVAVWDDAKEVFVPFGRFDREFGMGVTAQPVPVGSGGGEYFYFPLPLPEWRARPVLEDLAEQGAYEGFTPLARGARYAKAETQLDRNADGRLRYGWKRATPSLTWKQQEELIASGRMKPGERQSQLQDFVTGATVKPHAGSVCWNAWRRRWVMIVEEDRGLVDGGEIWYAEADSPTGPWVYARKVVTHDKYTFYNPAQHPFFDQQGGRFIYFEGTVSDTFSGAPAKIPAYDYNQMMYRLDLADERLVLPVPVYRMKDGRYLLRDAIDAAKAWGEVAEIPFFALEPRRRPQRVAVGGVFDALPVEPPAEEWTDGGMTCRTSTGEEFTLWLRRDGSAVRGWVEGTPVERGEVREGRVRLEIRFDGGLTRVEMSGKGRKWEGRWESEKERGTASCESKGASDWRRSPALVPLYARREGGRMVYSTEGKGPAAGRVWRNPYHADVLDRDASPR
jgi:hypothetical protein